MSNNLNKGFLLIFTLLLSAAFAVADVTVSKATVSPANPVDDDILECSFTVTGDQADYTVDVTWLKNGEAYTDDDQSDITAENNTATVTTTVGNIEASDTEEGDIFACVVTASDGTNSDELTSNEVEVERGTKIKITDVNVDCNPNCDDDDVDEDGANFGDAGRIREVRPDSELKIEFRVENLWDEDARDHEIQDVEIDCTLEDIGDEDEQDENVDFGDIDEGDRSDREEMTFTIPKDAEEDTYSLECTLKADDEDGTNYDFDFDMEVEVEKEKDTVVFTDTRVSPASVSCNRHITLSYDIANLGSNDQDDVQVSIRQTDLEFFENDYIGDLEEGDYGDSDTEYSNSYTYTVGDDVEPGTYTFRFEADYNDGDDSDVAIQDLIVNECVTTQPEDQDNEQEQNEPQVIVVQQPPTTPTQQPTTPTVAEPADDETAEVEAFTDSVWFIALLVAAIILLLALAIWMISVAFRK